MEHHISRLDKQILEAASKFAQARQEENAKREEYSQMAEEINTLSVQASEAASELKNLCRRAGVYDKGLVVETPHGAVMMSSSIGMLLTRILKEHKP